MQTIRVAVVGQPNVGKSYLLNSLSGGTLHVGNFPGVTVEKKEVQVERNGYRIILTDLPGIYSLHTYTPEESITKHYLYKQDYDVILNVAEANLLERNLTLTLQMLDLFPKVVLAANMYDEVEENSGAIDTDRFHELLGVPVVATSAKKKRGLENMLNEIIKLYRGPQPRQKIFYNAHIEEAISKIISYFKNSSYPYPARFIAIRLLEEDNYVYDQVHGGPEFFNLAPELRSIKKHLQRVGDEEDAKTVLFNERAAISRGLTAQVSVAATRKSITDKIDDLLIHPLLGIPIFLFLMWALFQLTFTVGSIPMDYIEGGFVFLQNVAEQNLPASMLTKALTDGVIPAVGAILMFLPNILILFLGLNLLEQTGYMARSAFLLDGFLKRFGLQGNAFIPLVSGFGCSVPAYMAARTLKNPRDKIITMLVIGFMSCGARLPVYVLFVGAFFPVAYQGNVLFAIYIFGALMGLVVAKILRVILFKGMPEPFVMEMPKYRVPSFTALFMDLYGKAKVFVRKAGSFIALAAFVIWVLSTYPLDDQLRQQYIYGEEAEISEASLGGANDTETPASADETSVEHQMLETSYLGRIGHVVQPIFAPMGFDWQLSVATLSALSAKEIAVSTLAVLYQQDSSKLEHGQSLKNALRANISFKTAVAFLLVMIIYSPCFAAMSTFFSEIPQWRWRILYVLYPNIMAWAVGVAAYQLLALLGV